MNAPQITKDRALEIAAEVTDGSGVSASWDSAEPSTKAAGVLVLSRGVRSALPVLVYVDEDVLRGALERAVASLTGANV